MNAGGDRPAEADSGAFAPVLEGCRSLFPPELLDSGGWKRLLDRAERLPRSVADACFGFEFHLAEPAAEADLCVVVLPGSDLSRHYVREGERAEPGSPPAALAAGLREQAGNPDSYLARAVASLILEYDLAGLAPGRPPPAPGVFLVPRPAASGPRAGRSEHRDPAGLLAALAMTVGWNGHEEMLGAVERIYAALPERGYVFQAGALPARSPRAFRIVVAGVGKEEVPALLERVGWLGPAGEAADVLASMDDLAAYVFVSLDVTARGPGPRLGLELYCATQWLEADRRGWRPLIARLEGARLVPSREGRGAAALAGDRTADRRGQDPPRPPGNQPRQGRRRTRGPERWRRATPACGWVPANERRKGWPKPS